MAQFKINPATGKLDLVGSGSTTVVTGPQGPPGIDGQDGEPGEQGEPGPQGAIGPQGTPGAAGASGTQGPPGVDGEDGADGEQGVPGPTGATGATGATGSTGATGAQGGMGPPGQDGFQEEPAETLYVPGERNHNLLLSLTVGDPHTQYLLLAGRSGTLNNPILTTTGSTVGLVTGASVNSSRLGLQSNTSSAAILPIQLQPNVTSFAGLSMIMNHQTAITLSTSSGFFYGISLGADETDASITWLVSSNLTNGGVVGYELSATLQNSPTNTGRNLGTTLYAFRQNLTLSHSGTSSSTAGDLYTVICAPTIGANVTLDELTSVWSSPSINGTITTRRGLHLIDRAGTGTQTNFIGVEIEDQTVGTLALSMRSVGTAVEMRHAGAVVVGANGAAGVAQILDVARDMALRRGADFSAANGANADVATAGKTFFRWTGGGAACTMDGFAGEGIDGKRLIVHNSTGSTIAVTSESASEGTAARRITVPAATTVLNNRSINLIYSTATSRWVYAQ